MIDSNLDPLRRSLAAVRDLVLPSLVLQPSKDVSGIGCWPLGPFGVSSMSCPMTTFFFADLIPNKLLELQRRFLTGLFVGFSPILLDEDTYLRLEKNLEITLQSLNL